MNTLRTGLVAMAAACLFSSAIAQSPVGSWKGKLNIKFPPAPANADASMKAVYEEQIAAVKKMVVNLTFSRNNTYSMATQGAPAQAGGEQKDNGTWKKSGKTLTLTSTKKNAHKNAKPQVLTLSADGKTLTLNLPGPQGASHGSIVFKRA